LPKNVVGMTRDTRFTSCASELNKLQICIGSLRVLTRQEEPNRQDSVEKLINEFLRDDVDSTVLASVERIGNAIDAEADKNVIGEDWAIM
jgi:hypothetical protein